mgnify:CR=1 FL=1
MVRWQDYINLATAKDAGAYQAVCCLFYFQYREEGLKGQVK